MPRCLIDTVKGPYSGFTLSNVGLRVDNRRMSSWPALGTGMHHLVCAYELLVNYLLPFLSCSCYLLVIDMFVP
ncbi:uncharacterized protein DS421_15g498900 [Arachis hypogaea]|nr:uncharacterized protein DS421_15g498900 [Arachis hypogaea]